MPQPALEQLIAFNDQLAALIDAGVPMETGLAAGPGDIQSQLQEINTRVARHVSQGTSFEEALAAAPPLYGSLVRTGLSTGELEIALRASNRLAESRTQAIQTAVFSLVYPLVILLLVYLGIVFFCLWLVPTLEQIYYSAGVAPRLALAILALLRESLAYWIAFPPVCLAAVFVFSRRALGASAARSAAGCSWLPGWWRAKHDSRAANYAHILAALLESGVPLPEALSMAAGAWDDPALTAAARALASRIDPAAADTDQPLAAALPNSFPPLLVWAMSSAPSAIGRPAALRLAADTYRASAQRRLDRWRVAAPLALCVVVGGGATLLYGLALFVPIIDLLEGLARP